MLIVACLVLWIGGIGVRLVHLQVTRHEWLKDRASAQRQNIKRSKLPRGSILDRNNRVLALSVYVKTLFADPAMIDDVESTAAKLSEVLGLDRQELFERLSEGKSLERRYVPIARGFDEEKVQEINRRLEDPSVRKADFPKYPGLYWRDDQRRSYPNGGLAAHIVGFSNAEGVGQAGIEQSRNEVLYGAIVKKVQERDRLGRVYDETVSEKEPPKDVVLTIQNSIQYKTEIALKRAAAASGAKAASAIVIANKTGEILALANYPTYNPNEVDKITSENLSNRAIQGIYSPGSVFKLVTYASALETGKITPDGLIDPGSGSIEVGGHRFTDSHSLGSVTFAKALAVSSNVCAIKTGMMAGRQGFFETVENFGFGRRTGIELPAEAKGIVRRPEKWYGDSMASMSIGYEIGVSLLQMATAFATIANDGVRIQPHIIKEIRNSDQTIFSAAKPEQTRVVSEKTARDLREMLREVVLTGTGKMARLNNYSSAGKTGTAWKFDEKLKRVTSSKYVSSFIGFAPVESPEITIAVAIDEPRIGGRNGGQVAAPVFREIAEQVLPELKVPSDIVSSEPVIVDEILDESIGNGEDAAVDSLDLTKDDGEEPTSDLPGPVKEVLEESAEPPEMNPDNRGKDYMDKQAVEPVKPEKRNKSSTKETKIENTNRN